MYWHTIQEKQVTFRDGECRRPLRSQDIQTDATIAVNVWVIYTCGESNLYNTGMNNQLTRTIACVRYEKLYLRRFERIVCWKVNGEKEDSTLVGAVRLEEKIAKEKAQLHKKWNRQ